MGLQRFVTADEAKWVYRSAQFWQALLQGNWEGTVVKLKPAVTTMWSAGPAFWLFNCFHDNLPFADFLAAVPQWQVDPAMLHATRMPTILLSCASIVLVYLLLQSELGRWSAFWAALFLAFDPLFLAHSRFLHHDAMVTLFALPALLLAIRAAKGGWVSLIASAIMAGLAFLTKSPIFFLGVFVGGLLLFVAWRESRQNGQIGRKMLVALGRLMLWGLISYFTFVIIWPAAWSRPIGLPFDVIFDAVQAAAPESDDNFINLGPFYYPVYFLFYSTLPVLAGLVVWAFQRKKMSDSARYTTQALAWFALTFVVFMTLSDKRSARYILPAIVAVDVVAAAGWAVWLARRTIRIRVVIVTAILLVQLLAVIPYAPYYITYTDPAVGGPFTAPRLIKIGWGEGMDQVGAWLNTQPHPESSRVGAAYASTLSPYFVGQVVGPTEVNLDYVVAYIKQQQGGSPPPEILAYYEQIVQPQKTIMLSGINYAQIYPGPAAQPVEPSGPVFAVRPHTNFAPIGQKLTVDLIWPASSEFSVSDRAVTLRGEDQIWAKESIDTIFLSAGDVPVTRHTLSLPADLPPGTYTLFYKSQPLDQIEARYTQAPAHFKPLPVNFGDEIQLIGYNPNYSLKGDQLIVDLAFQAIPKAWADYTVFVHLVDEAGGRLAGHDAQPALPTSQWLKGEVVLDSHALTLPAELPPGQYQVRVGLYRPDTGEALGEAYILPLEVSIE